MDLLFIIAATAALLMLPLCVFLLWEMRKARRWWRHAELENVQLKAQGQHYEELARESKALRLEHARMLEEKSVAITEMHEMSKQLKKLEAVSETLLAQKEEAVLKRMHAEKQVALAEQRMQEQQRRMEDWEKGRQESMQHAKASVLEAGVQLSSKLLEDHKREVETAKKDAEMVVQRTTEGLHEKMLQVTNIVATLQNTTQSTNARMDTVWRALTTPAQAGQLAEIGLENTLKNLGLETPRDFIMQYAMSGEFGQLRPDAVIFLPQQQVMVIDSKASKYLLEIAQAESEAQEAESLQRFKKTMNDHLKALSGKDYASAIAGITRSAGRGGNYSRIYSVMYVPSESALTHIKRADSEFESKLQKAGIVLAGPSTLHGILQMAQSQIRDAQKDENQEKIMKAVQEMMDYTVTLLSYAEGVGKSLKTSAENFSKFSASANQRFLPKLRQLQLLGIRPGKSKDLPQRITGYEVHVSGDMLTIDAESETLEPSQPFEVLPQKLSA